MKKVVQYPVVDVRSLPSLETRVEGGHDRNRFTQLLFGMYADVISQNSLSSLVDIFSQGCGHDEGFIRPYRGYVVSEALIDPVVEESYPAQNEFSIENFIDTARTYIDQPYVWGGLSVLLDGYTMCETGIDCSGLVYMTYAHQGIFVPRDARDQYAFCQKKPFHEKTRGDLLFLQKKGKKISHVMIFDGEGVIEASGEVMKVRSIRLSEVVAKISSDTEILCGRYEGRGG